MAKTREMRHKEIVGTARALFFEHGYDASSVQEIIDTVGIAKGTFYHYFKGKDQLLEAVIEEITDEIIDQLEPIAHDPGRTATDRIVTYFQQSMIFKARNPDLMYVALHTMYREENTKLRLSMVDRTIERVAPVLGAIVRNGVETGEFTVDDPELCGDFIIRSFSTLSEKSARIILSAENVDAMTEELFRVFDFMEWSLARLLAVPRERINLADRTVVGDLFGEVHRRVRSEQPHVEKKR